MHATQTGPPAGSATPPRRGKRFVVAATVVSVLAGPLAIGIASPAGAAPAVTTAGDPTAVSFTLEGCRNDGTIVLPNGSGDYVCPDSAYTTGNLGKGWAELDLVPYRVTAQAGNSAPSTQTYTIAYAVDRKDAGKDGYDVLSSAKLNTALSIGSCPAPTVGSETIATPGIGGVSETLYRTLTVTQSRGTSCVYDFHARLALGSHLYPGSSLHANLALLGSGGSLDTGGIGARDVSIPVRELAPQELDKDMAGSQGSDHTWNLTKQVSPASLSLANTCDVQGDYATASVDETITWTKSSAIPGAATLTTNIYATNPASRSIDIRVRDRIYSGTTQTTQLDDTQFSVVTVPPHTRLLIGTHTYTWANPTTSQVNDVATAQYTDTATGAAIPGETRATASATIQSNGPGTNDSAVIDDSQVISGNGLQFSVDAVQGASGSFSGYTLGGRTAGPVRWTSDSQSSSGSVTFRKTLYAAKGTVEPNGSIGDAAALRGSDGFTASATASAAVTADARASLSLTKSIPAGIITRGTESQQFVFDIVRVGGTSGDDTVATARVDFEAGETGKVAQIADLAPGNYRVVERPAAGWVTQSPQTVDLSGAVCRGSVDFTNVPQPAQVKAVKVTVPSGFESGWSMALYRGDDTTPIAEGTTDDSGLIDFGPIDSEGDYVIRETGQAGWSSSSARGCSFTVDLPRDGGTTFRCQFTNTFQPTVTLDKTGDRLSKVGDRVHYAITVANTSPAGASSGTPELTCRVTDAALGFDESVTLGADDSRTWSDLEFTIPSGSDPYVNRAAASCSFQGASSIVATANGQWSTELFQPQITVRKTADRAYAQVGDRVTYTVRITNTGSTDSPALVPDGTAAFSDPLVPSATLPADCDSLDVGESCEFSYDYVVKAGDSVVPNTASVLFHPEGFPNDVRGSDTVSFTVIHPSFTVTKTCSTPDFPAGTTVIFRVDVVNTGDVPLQITLDDTVARNGSAGETWALTGSNTTATATSDVVNSAITFQDGWARFPIAPGAHGQFEISVGIANERVANTITATGGLTSTHQGTTYNESHSARDVCIDAPPEGATRTIGFWRTHVSFLRQVLNSRPLPAAAVVGTSPLGVGENRRFINGYLKLSTSGRFPLRSVDDVLGVFWASNSQNSNGSKRVAICQARITTAKQLLGAILNQSFGNPKPLPLVNGVDLITAALRAMDTNDAQSIRAIGTLLDQYNNGGDGTTIVIPGSLTIGKADPTAAQALANLAAGNC